MIALERKRTERSKVHFLLMLVALREQDTDERSEAILDKIASSLIGASRETDVVGWYKGRATLGVMFTGLAGHNHHSILDAIARRVQAALQSDLTFDVLMQVSLTFHFFPGDWDISSAEFPGISALYLDVAIAAKRRKALLAVKRIIDVAVSVLALIFLSPLFLAIALAIKVSSKGPVFFRQERIGQYGKRFKFLKFRSMFVDNDHLVHKQFVTELITRNTAHEQSHSNGGIYKIRDDKRITRVGRFIRRTSLDELPQLLNVLKGEMSMVGPRPAIPYEVEAYQTWHRRRIFEAKPGITGVWQVMGRSRVKFDEMVRMDLRYAMAWSPWLDLKILLLTPFAVIRGTGAY